jgi:hypothetical protein
MAHFAKVDRNTVIKVIVAEENFFDTFIDTEPGEWIQTSYNTRHGVHYESDGMTPSADQSKALRKNFASVGFTYDRGRDAFIPPKPYNSWILDENTCIWKAPIDMPADYRERVYSWNESTLSWDEVTPEE